MKKICSFINVYLIFAYLRAQRRICGINLKRKIQLLPVARTLAATPQNILKHRTRRNINPADFLSTTFLMIKHLENSRGMTSVYDAYDMTGWMQRGRVYDANSKCGDRSHWQSAAFLIEFTITRHLSHAVHYHGSRDVLPSLQAVNIAPEFVH